MYPGGPLRQPYSYTRFQAPVDCYKIPALPTVQRSTVWPKRRSYLPNQIFRRMYSTAVTLNQSKDRRFCSSDDWKKGGHLGYLTNPEGMGISWSANEKLKTPIVYDSKLVLGRRRCRGSWRGLPTTLRSPLSTPWRADPTRWVRLLIPEKADQTRWVRFPG